MLYRIPSLALVVALAAGDVVAGAPPVHRPSDNFGAIALDGVADNEAIQKAFYDAGLDGGEVIIDGVYEVRQGAWQSLGNPYRRFGVYVTQNAKTVRVRCIGGGGFRAIGPIAGTGTDFILVGTLFTMAPVFFDGCHFDMSARESGWSEQQHALELFYGSKQVHGRDLVFYHPSLGPSAGGDCIRMVGGYTEGELVRDVSFTDTTFLACDRSEFGFQRSVQGVSINHFIAIGGTDNNLDQEATGVLDPILDPDGLTRIRDIHVSGATIIRPGGGNAVTLGRGIGMSLRDSAILGASVYMLSCEDCILDTVRIQAPCSTEGAAITVRRTSRRVTLDRLSISRASGCTGAADPLVYIVADPDGRPADIALTNSVIRQSASNVAVMVRASGADLRGNTIRYEGPTPANSNAVAVVYETLYDNRASGTMVGNSVVGAWYAVANVSPHQHPVNNPEGDPVGPVSFVGNTFDGPVRGIRCTSYATLPLLFRSIVRAANNNAGASWLDECPIATLGG